MPKILLTEKIISKGLSCPSTKRRIEYCDTQLPGLYLEIRATSPDQGTYYLRYKDDTGKTCHQKLGRTCDISLKQAREEAKRLRAEIQLGANPRAEARAKKAVMTWRVYMETIYFPHSRAHLRGASYLESLNAKYLKPLFHQSLNTISLETAQKLHRDMVEVHGLSPASADHLAKLMRQALNYAVRLDLIDSSPVSKIQLFNVDNREERLMSDQELKRLMSILQTDRNRTACLVLKWLLFTGCRVNSEALQARWSDIDRKHRTWTIQAIHSKSKQRRSVPISDAALAVLDQLGTEGKSEWVFISSRSGGRLTTINKAWQRIRKEVGLEHVRLHDLRHMHASMLINSGHSLYVVQQVLGHSDPSVTQRYAHLSTATLQAAANSVGQYLDKALDKTGDK